MWYDNWHPLGPLLENFGPRIVYDATLPLYAIVTDIIEGGEWHWPRTNTIELMEVQSGMCSVPSPSDTQDIVQWIPLSYWELNTYQIELP